MKEYTVKQIAEITEVSKPTVRAKIKQLKIEPIHKDDSINTVYYSYDDTITIIKALKPSYDFSSFPENKDTGKFSGKTGKAENELENDKKFSGKLENHAAVPTDYELLKNTLSVLESQLALKDRQLEEKDKQISELLKRLSDSMEVTKGLQYITAADKTTQMLQANSGTAAQEQQQEPQQQKTEEPKRKRKFWDRVFNKS